METEAPRPPTPPASDDPRGFGPPGPREVPAPRGRANHYEVAFAGYVHGAGLPCVPIDQARRPAEGRALGLKNPDFLVYPRSGPALVVEVKGKRARDGRGRRAWENWVTIDDLDGLARWREMYGPGYRPILAFAYAEPIPEGPAGGLAEGLHALDGWEYRFWAVGLDDYLDHLRSRGPAWRAVAMARREFRRRVRPLSEWLGLPPPVYNPRRRRRRRSVIPPDPEPLP